MSKSRQVTIKLLEMLDEGLFNQKDMIRDLLNYLSEDDVKDFAESNDYYSIDEGSDDE